MTPCKNCLHTKDQHDEDGFCEQVINPTDNFYCQCPGFEPREEENKS